MNKDRRTKGVFDWLNAAKNPPPREVSLVVLTRYNERYIGKITLSKKDPYFYSGDIWLLEGYPRECRIDLVEYWAYPRQQN